MPTRTVPGMAARSQTSAQDAAAPGRPGGEDVIEGTVLDISGEPYRRTLSAWQIRVGRINRVDVSGQVVLVISSRLGRALEGPWSRVVLLDERALPEQVLALVDAFRGWLGGDGGESAAVGAKDHAFCQVPIEATETANRIRISVPDRLRLGIDLDRRVASEVSVAIPEHGLGWLARDVSVSYREIRVGACGEEVTCHG